jgi:hypothetical protein
MDKDINLLKDITFCIPLRIDTKERWANINRTLTMLSTFKTNVALVIDGEMPMIQSYMDILYDNFSTSDFNLNIEIHVNTDPVFRKVVLINDMVRKITTKYIAIYDADVIFKAEQYIETYRRLKECDVVYFYDGYFCDIPNNLITMSIDFNHFESIKKPHTFQTSFGGAFAIRLSKFIEAGGANENFIGWGYEDNEFYVRFYKLGYSIARTCGDCYHFMHPRNENSWFSNPNIKSNEEECEKVKKMSTEELKKYISQNNWIKKI